MSFIQYLHASAFAQGTQLIFYLPHPETHCPSRHSASKQHQSQVPICERSSQSWPHYLDAPKTICYLKTWDQHVLRIIIDIVIKIVLRSNNIEKHLLKGLCAERMLNVHRNLQDRDNMQHVPNLSDYSLAQKTHPRSWCVFNMTCKSCKAESQVSIYLKEKKMNRKKHNPGHVTRPVASDLTWI